MNQIDEHNESMGFPTGATALFVVVGFWICVIAALIMLLNACATTPTPAPIDTIAPARVVCVSSGVITLDIVLDSAQVQAGKILTITLDGSSALLEMPQGTVCEVRP